MTNIILTNQFLCPQLVVQDEGGSPAEEVVQVSTSGTALRFLTSPMITDFLNLCNNYILFQLVVFIRTNILKMELKKKKIRFTDTYLSQYCGSCSINTHSLMFLYLYNWVSAAFSLTLGIFFIYQKNLTYVIHLFSETPNTTTKTEICVLGWWGDRSAAEDGDWPGSARSWTIVSWFPLKTVMKLVDGPWELSPVNLTWLGKPQNI